MNYKINLNKLKISNIPIWSIGTIISIIWFMPFIWMLSTSLKLPENVITKEIIWLPKEITFGNYVRMLEFPIIRWFLNSGIQAICATTLTVISGAMAGYAFSILKFPGNKIIFLIFLTSIMIPPEVALVPLLLAFIKTGYANTYISLILPTIANVFSVYIFRQFFINLSKELIDSAKMDGASHLRIFFSIAFPMARAPLIATTVLIFTLNWNNFVWPLLVTFEENMKTLPVGIAQFSPVTGSYTQEGYALKMAAVSCLALPSLLLFFFLQKYFITGLSQGSVKG
ncbi:MAG: carbohydrate ABC transporter permease [SAR324 cluster bacterium]|nr:carbohydrate ABC transporter permease [SAR324 cluster bacterium]